VPLLINLVTKLIRWSEMPKLPNIIIWSVSVKKKKLKEPSILETEMKENLLVNSPLLNPYYISPPKNPNLANKNYYKKPKLISPNTKNYTKDLTKNYNSECS